MIGRKSIFCTIKRLPNDEILNASNLKALADKMNMTEKLKFVIGRVENIVRI